MLNRFFTSSVLQTLFFTFLTVFPPVETRAQQCEAPYEAITRFHKPDPGAAMVWQTFYNEYGIVASGREARFVSAYGLDDGDVLVAGLTRKMRNARSALILARFDDRGRARWEKIHNVPSIVNIEKLLPDKERGSIVLGNLNEEGERASLWIGFFDEEGNLRSSEIIKDQNYDLYANDIHPSIDGDGWVLPVSEVQVREGNLAQSQRNATIYLLNEAGKKRGMRSYILGQKTELFHVGAAVFAGEKQGFIATGCFENGVGKNIAWVMRLNADLSLVWQKEYSRGLSARLVSSTVDEDGGVLVVGDVNSADSSVSGVWLAKLDGEYGEMQWQRYYTSTGEAYSYKATSLGAHEDGRVSLLMTGEVVLDKKNHADGVDAGTDEGFGHLLTLSARGDILSGAAFYAGQGSHVSSMSIDGAGRRIFVGDSLMESYTDVKRIRQERESNSAPLHEKDDINLPDVQLSDKAEQGLALLKKKMFKEDVTEGVKHDFSSFDGSPDLLQKGWVFIPETDQAYVDPCD